MRIMCLSVVTLTALFLALGTPAKGGVGCSSPKPLPATLRAHIDARGPETFEFQRAWKGKTARARQNRRAMAEDPGILFRSPQLETAVSGLLRIPVVLVGFNGNASGDYTRTDYLELFNGPWASGSLSDYFDEVSYNFLDVDSYVLDWISVPSSSAYYTAGESGVGPNSLTGEFLEEALDAHDSTFPFDAYDNDGPDGVPNSGDDDGFVDIVIFVHNDFASEETSCGTDNNFWSHRSTYSGWHGNNYKTDDSRSGGGKIRIDDYLIISAKECSGSIRPIGTIAHELGHALGIPDLYDTIEDGSSCRSDPSNGIGHWGLMGSGNWNSQTSPAHPSAWTKVELGWIVPAEVTSDLVDWPVLPSTTSPTAFKLWHDGIYNGDEYWLVESRSRQGFDANIKSPGFLIWHVDESKLDPDNNDENSDECSPLLDLECANQTASNHTIDHDDLAAKTTRSAAGHVFASPGLLFDNFTTPGAVTYQGDYVSVSMLTTECDTTLNSYRATFSVGAGPPTGTDLCITDCGADDCAEPSGCARTWLSPSIYVDNDRDGIADLPERGAYNNFQVSVKNPTTNDVAGAEVFIYYGSPAIGARIPVDLVRLGEATVPLIPATSEVIVDVSVLLGTPYPGIEEYCYAAIVFHSDDPVHSDNARDDNNIAVLNAQEFWLSGTPLRGELSDVRSTEVSNWHAPTCDVEIFLGPPGAQLPPDWQYDISPTSFTIGYGESQTVDVVVTTMDPDHMDEVLLPLRARCLTTGELLGGGRFKWTYDSIAPDPPTGLTATVDLRGDPGDGSPLKDAVLLSWEDSNPNPQEVRSWHIFRTDSVRTFVGKFAEDELEEEPGWQVLLDLHPDTAQVFYDVIASDRAGNKSVRASAPLIVLNDDPPASAPIGEALSSVWVYPNPTGGTVSVNFEMSAVGLVSLEVFDLAGRLLRRVAPHTVGKGRGMVQWDGRDVDGDPATAGTYLLRLYQNGNISTHKVVLMR